MSGPSGRTIALLGTTFVSPLFDYMLIGGGLSLVVGAVVLLNTNLTADLSTSALPLFILLSNSAHFAASTVRLYTKPDSLKSFPFLTMVFPIVAMAILTIAIAWPGQVGKHIQALYLTWSPYHYAAQAYGLAVMYSYRSKCQLSLLEKRVLWWICLLPFLRSFIGAPNSGLGWFVSRDSILQHEWLASGLNVVTGGLALLTFAMPVVLFLKFYFKRESPMPLISLLVVVTNGVWWVLLDYIDAFVWATIFHGIQYMAIVIIFHVKDQMRRPENRHSPLYHVCWFYGACLLLGYGLFYCWPHAYVLAGFGLAESMLLVVAIINIHHFVVDAYVWRLRKDRNYQNVVQAPADAQPT